MYHKARGLKSRSVSESLRSKRGFASNQGEVWDSVEEMHEELGTESSTGAMRDAYTVRSGRLDQWEEAFPIVPGQLGMAFIANGRVLGLELVSRPAAYRQLHRRLLRSYTLDVDLDTAAESGMDPRVVVEAFLASLDSLEEHGHAAVGHGTDWRYEGTQTCGAVLAHADTCIHAAFFNIPESKRRSSAPFPTDGAGVRRTGTDPEPSLARQSVRPIEQSYWVVPGRLLAGEYPRTLDRDESIMKLRSLVAAGVTTFIDLTEVRDKLAPYADLLNEVSQGRARHHSFPIIDVGIPASHELTREILDLIDSKIAAGEIVYVHCWGGVGRTGTIVGCWLARHGYAGGAALKRLTELWSACPKSRTRVSPETGAQRHYVQTWNG